MRHRLAAIAVLVLALLLVGCQALGQALGVQPRADAPAYYGVGVVNNGQSNEGRAASRADQSGAVGAQGSAQQSAEQSLEIPAEAVEALVAAAQQALAAGNPAAAASILGAIPKKEKPAAPTPAPASPPPADRQ